MKANEVLKNVELMIERADNQYRRRYKIWDVCDGLGIFDWWNDYLSVSQLKDMRKFLKEAIKLGFTEEVSFKVGATGCSNGMWAKNQAGEELYKSFAPDRNYWSVSDAAGHWFPENDYDRLNTMAKLEGYWKTYVEYGMFFE